MIVLMLAWEFPPFIVGGLGMACYGLVKALLRQKVEILLVLPAEKLLYFRLTKPEDADLLNPSFLDREDQEQFKAERFESIEDSLKFLGLSVLPESYLNPSDAHRFQKVFKRYMERKKRGDDDILNLLISSLNTGETIIQKVKEYSMRIEMLSSSLDFDLIHAHDWLTYPAAVALKEKTGKPLIAHIHATEFDRAGGIGNYRLHNIEYAGLSIADLVITVSKYTASLLIQRYRINKGKIRVIHNAYQLGRGVQDVTHRQVKKRIFKGPVILFLGRLTFQKGPDIFLEVAKRIIEKKPNVRFIMAGAGDMEKKLIHKSAYYRLKTNILFTGFLDRSDVIRVLNASDIMLLPSVSEPFGIASLEAMSCGLVTIISKQSGVSEIARNVFKINYWDIDKMESTILELLNKSLIRKKMGRAGAKEAARITWHKTAVLTRKIYEELLCLK